MKLRYPGIIKLDDLMGNEGQQLRDGNAVGGVNFYSGTAFNCILKYGDTRAQ
jgi:hypothetical protein